ncbi:hypothetical protein ACJRO7_010713 [Eucalyptus globulus]|uniref:Uncharacterized protein n=1 Tax=Eucalyptus globulus TaxID=34317 RepID=A0ABD3LDP3_EUCGL
MWAMRTPFKIFLLVKDLDGNALTGLDVAGAVDLGKGATVEELANFIAAEEKGLVVFPGIGPGDGCGGCCWRPPWMRSRGRVGKQGFMLESTSDLSFEGDGDSLLRGLLVLVSSCWAKKNLKARIDSPHPNLCFQFETDAIQVAFGSK